MANLIVCCDGTWNTPDDKDGGVPTPTNVVKIKGCVAAADTGGEEQKIYYHTGVGTEGGLVNSVAGGGFGVGLADNVKSAYKWLAVTYKPGDRIFLFGFSRGAFTVRSLAGLIGICGLLDLSDHDISDDDLWHQIDKVFAVYREDEPDPGQLVSLNFYNTETGKPGSGKTEIHFLGVWDTVGSLGIPDEVALLNLLDDPRKHAFHDTKLSSDVVHARHAVAIDEMRQSFTPTLWTAVSEHNDVKQIWFPGVHSDVGGGYAQTGLSDGALLWMLDEAEACGLNIRSGARQQIHPDAHDVLHDSLTGVFKALHTRPRSVPNLAEPLSLPEIHSSATERFRNPPLAQPDYWPTKQLEKGDSVTIDIFARERWNSTGLFLQGGTTYEMTAKGQWVDSTIPCGPGGTKDGKFSPGEVFHLAGSALGSLEGIFRRITGNVDADFWMTRREENIDWFALVGVVANGAGTKSDGTENGGSAVKHETFLIGDGVKYTPKSDGYLYAFANDAWQMYFNNKGSVRLTVRQI